MGLMLGDFRGQLLNGDQQFLFCETLFEGIRKLNFPDKSSEFLELSVDTFNPKLLFADIFGEASRIIGLFRLLVFVFTFKLTFLDFGHNYN